MPGPIDSLRFVHTAILTEADHIDRAAADAQGGEDLEALADGIEFFENLVLLHTRGEELGLFPVVAEAAPHLDETYLLDHEDERRTFTALREAVATGDLTGARRAAVVLREHARAHITKENTLILPFVGEHFEPPKQAEMIGTILSTIPPEQMAEVVPWIIERISIDEAEAYVGVLEHAMPPEVFGMAKGWIREGVAAGTWDELSSRVPALTS